MISLKFFENYMKVMGPLGTLMFYIQAHKIFATKSAVAISVPAFILGVITYISWLIYSILIKNKPIMLTSISGCIGSILILIGKYIYG